jgi:hypothetical protein
MTSLKTVCLAAVLLLVTATSLPYSEVWGARCQITHVSYSIPQQAAPSQQITSATNVAGSCVSDGEDYYSVRVDLVDASTASIVNSNSTPIGYNATYFNATVENIATTPPNNGTWNVITMVYVVRAGGTGGSYLLDYTSSSNATIQIGGSTPVPEFPFAQALITAFGLCSLAILIRKRRATSRV